MRPTSHHPSPRSHRDVSAGQAGFSLLELMLVVAIMGLLAAAAVPAFSRYIKRVKTSEAVMLLREMYNGATAYFDTEHADGAGQILPHQFPSTAGPTPALATIGIERVVTNWHDSGTWDALKFGIADPHYFAYQFDSSGIDAASQFTASAFGNLDGDAVFSTFVRFATVDAMTVRGSQGLWIQNELE